MLCSLFPITLIAFMESTLLFYDYIPSSNQGRKKCLFIVVVVAVVLFFPFKGMIQGRIQDFEPIDALFQ